MIKYLEDGTLPFDENVGQSTLFALVDGEGQGLATRDYMLTVLMTEDLKHLAETTPNVELYITLCKLCISLVFFLPPLH